MFINTAAKVKYNGHLSEFKKNNIDTVKNVIDICIKNDIVLEQISTMSVSGIGGTEALTESKLYIGQNYKVNPYIETKFKAEILIYKNIKENGLKANVYRVGNLTWRLSDGKYQQNLMENAFFLRLKTIYDLSICTEEISEYDIDLTPVDIASIRIVNIITNINKINSVYHIYNNKTKSFGEIMDVFSKNGRKIRFVTDKEFIKQIEVYDSKYNIILNDISGGLSKTNKNISNKNTNDLIKDNWPNIDENYINKIIKYLEGRNK